MLHFYINESVKTSRFPNELKIGDITSLFKNGDAFAKNNYWPITVVPAVSKITNEYLQVKLFATRIIICLPIFVRNG